MALAARRPRERSSGTTSRPTAGSTGEPRRGLPGFSRRRGAAPPAPPSSRRPRRVSADADVGQVDRRPRRARHAARFAIRIASSPSCPSSPRCPGRRHRHPARSGSSSSRLPADGAGDRAPLRQRSSSPPRTRRGASRSTSSSCPASPRIFPEGRGGDPLLLDQARASSWSGARGCSSRTRGPAPTKGASRFASRSAPPRVVVVLSYPRRRRASARRAIVLTSRSSRRGGRLGDFRQLAKRRPLTADARIGWPAPPRSLEDAIDEGKIRPRAPARRSRRTRTRSTASHYRRRRARIRTSRDFATPTCAGRPEMTRPTASVSRRASRSRGRSPPPPSLPSPHRAPELRGLPVSLPPLRGPQARPRPAGRRHRRHGSLTRGSLTHDVLFHLLSELAEEEISR